VPADDVRLADEILAQFTDAASARFDQALGSMPLDDSRRRELKYWQRQSLAALRQYAAVALPGAIAAVTAAQSDALASLEAAGRTWADARAEPVEVRLLAVSNPEEPVPNTDEGEEPNSLEVRRRTVAARLASGA
jgi:hypothetical protein